MTNHNLGSVHLSIWWYSSCPLWRHSLNSRRSSLPYFTFSVDTLGTITLGTSMFDFVNRFREGVKPLFLKQQWHVQLSWPNLRQSENKMSTLWIVFNCSSFELQIQVLHDHWFLSIKILWMSSLTWLYINEAWRISFWHHNEAIPLFENCSKTMTIAFQRCFLCHG